MAARRQVSQSELAVYWMPHCSSCMAVKRFLDDRGVAYRSVNVVEDDEAMTRLAVLGVRSVPVLVRGDEFVFAQYLQDVAEFIQVDGIENRLLDVDKLLERLIMVLDVAYHALGQLASERLSDNLLGRERSYFVVSHHIFQIAAAAMRGLAIGVLRDSDSLAEPGSELITKDDLALFAADVVSWCRGWTIRHHRGPAMEMIETDYGPQLLTEVMHRVVSHVAQHTRQLVAHVSAVRRDSSIAFGAELTAGLTLAEDVFDQVDVNDLRAAKVV